MAFREWKIRTWKIYWMLLNDAINGCIEMLSARNSLKLNIYIYINALARDIHFDVFVSVCVCCTSFVLFVMYALVFFDEGTV